MISSVMALILSTALANDAIGTKAVKEAENLTLLQDRLSACATIYKAYKKTDKGHGKPLKEKLHYFATVFYTDKGFQDYLAGKDLFSKEKYPEAAEKLLESDTLEKNNTDVLRLLALAQLWSKKPKLAAETNAKALQINPIDEELLKDKLAILSANEDWADVVLAAGEMPEKNSALVQYFKGAALIKLQKKAEAKAALDMALTKDKNYPEVYFWQSELELTPVKKETLLKKYNELCKKPNKSERDTFLCSRATEKSI